MRRAALRDHAVAGDLTILHVVPGGPFARAGLERGDQILSFDGIRPKTRGELRTHLFTHPALKSAGVRIRRGDEEWDRQVPLTPACPVLFELGAGAGLTTWQNRKVVVVAPRGLLRYAKSDDLLAAVLGHQLAHALFDRDSLDDLASERRADRRGAIIAANAGFRVSGLIAYWEDVARSYPWLITPEMARPARIRRNTWRPGYLARQFQHHDIARRIRGIRRVVAEVGQRLPEARPQGSRSRRRSALSR